MPANSAAWKAIFSLLLRPPFCRLWQKRGLLSPSITRWEKVFCPPTAEHRRKLWSNGYCCWDENYKIKILPEGPGGMWASDYACAYEWRWSSVLLGVLEACGCAEPRAPQMRHCYQWMLPHSLFEEFLQFERFHWISKCNCEIDSYPKITKIPGGSSEHGVGRASNFRASQVWHLFICWNPPS